MQSSDLQPVQRFRTREVPSDLIPIDDYYEATPPVVWQMTCCPHDLADRFVQLLLWLTGGGTLHLGNDPRLLFSVVGDDVRITFEIWDAVRLAPALAVAHAHAELNKTIAYSKRVGLHLDLTLPRLVAVPPATGPSFLRRVNVDANAPAILRAQ